VLQGSMNITCNC